MVPVVVVELVLVAELVVVAEQHPVLVVELSVALFSADVTSFFHL